MDKWISVEDRLPDGFANCLVSDGEKVEEAIWTKRTKNDTWKFVFTSIKNITHWRPLPSAPGLKDEWDHVGSSGTGKVDDDGSYWYTDTEFPGMKIRLNGIREFIIDSDFKLSKIQLEKLLKGIGYWCLHQINNQQSGKVDEVENDYWKKRFDELFKITEYVGRNANKINEYTWKAYKEQIIAHVEDAELLKQQSIKQP
jgi:hypothetical protein